MAEASISVDHDQFSCPVCLDLLRDPVTIQCGHNFCMQCINSCWDQEDQKGVYSCPQCRETFTPRPVLRRNNMLAAVVEKLKKTELQAASPAPGYSGPGDVECDFCSGKKNKAIKSCLTCLVSFCEDHLKPHFEVPGLKKHMLVKASTQLEQKICSQHNEVMKIYCPTDQSCICYLCMVDQHKGHDTVSAAAQKNKKQIRIRDPNQGGRDITEEIMPRSRSLTPPVGHTSSTPTPTLPQIRIRDPNQGGRDITEEIMPRSRSLTPLVGHTSSTPTPTPPQMTREGL